MAGLIARAWTVFQVERVDKARMGDEKWLAMRKRCSAGWLPKPVCHHPNVVMSFGGEGDDSAGQLSGM